MMRKKLTRKGAKLEKARRQDEAKAALQAAGGEDSVGTRRTIAASPSPLAEDAVGMEALRDASLTEGFLTILQNTLTGMYMATGKTATTARRRAMEVVRATGLGMREPLNEITKAAHYNAGRFEVITVIDDWDLDFYRGQIIKYLSRPGLKTNEVLPDLKKAKYYLDRLVDLTESGEGPMGHG